MTNRVAILISGGGSNMVSLVNAMQDGGFAEPALVLSNVPNAGGLTKAEAMGVPTAVVDHRSFADDRLAFEREMSDKLNAYTFDTICLAGFMRVLSGGFVSNWQGRMLNIHPSLLPKYQGLHTHERALEAGDREHGCTVHLVTPKLDDGPILGQAMVSVRDTDDAQTLADRVLVQEHLLYPLVLQRFLAGKQDTVRIDARDS